MRAFTVGVVCVLLAAGCGGNNDPKLASGEDTGNNGTTPDLGVDQGGGTDPDMGGTTDLGGDDVGTAEDAGTDSGAPGEDAGTDMGGTDMSTNQPPVANAGPDQDDAQKNQTTRLNGEASSDPDGDPLTFAWTQISGTTVTLDDPTTETPAFTSPFVSGALVFRLTVSDGTDTADDDVTITITNYVPVAKAGADQDAARGSVITLDGSQSSDFDGEPLTYAWSQVSGPSVSLSDATSEMPSFTTPDAFGDLVFELSVTDGEDSGTDQTTVSIVNLPPIAEAGPDQDLLAQGDAATLDGSGSSDPEGQPLTYSWTQVGGATVTLSDATAVSPSFTTPVGTGGAFVFELVVNDGNSDSPVDRVTVTTPNDPPVANAGADDLVNSGELVFLDGRGSFDPNGDGFNYAWTQTAGPPVDFGNGDRARAYFKAPDGAQQTLTFELTVTNSQGTSTDSVSFQTVPWNGTTVTLPPNPFATTFRPFLTRTTAIEVVADRLFAAGFAGTSDNVAVYDVSTPNAPALVATAKSAAVPSRAVFDGTTALVGSASGIESFAYDDNAGTLTLVDTVPLPAGVTVVNSMKQSGDTLFATLYNSARTNFVLAAFDVQNPASMSLLHTETLATNSTLAVRTNEVWVGGQNSLSVYDTSAIRDATPALTELTDDLADDCTYLTNSMWIEGDTLFASCGTNVELAVFDISVPSQPNRLRVLDEPGSGLDVVVDQNIAYVAADASGVLVFDVSTPANPAFLGSIATSQRAVNVRLGGGAVYALMSDNNVEVLEPVVNNPEFAASVVLGTPVSSIARLSIQDNLLAAGRSTAVDMLDVSDVANIQPYASIPVNGRTGVIVDFPYLYASGAGDGLAIVDVRLPAQPVTLATLLDNLEYWDMALDGDRLVAAVDTDGVKIYDVSNPNSPATLGTFDTGERFRHALVEGDLLYAGGPDLHVVDLANPALPVSIGSAPFGSPSGQLEKSGNFVWNGFGATSWRRYDVSDPAALGLESMTPFGGISQIRVNGAIAWLSQQSGGVVTVDVSDPANPVVLERYAVSDARALVVGNDEIWVADGDTLRAIRIDNAQFATRYETANTSQVLTYDVSWQEPGTGAGAICFVSAGTCNVTAVNAGAKTATVQWTAPGAAGDHEIVVVVGHSATRAFLRDRVSVQ